MSYQKMVTILKTNAARTPGCTKDLFPCFKEGDKYEFAEKTFSAGEKMGIDWETILSLPRQKQVKRAIQFVNACLTGILLDFDYTHARILCAARLAGSYDLNTDALIVLAANKRVSGDANLRGISSSAVNVMFEHAHALGTVQTKISNMTGVNGWAQILGVTYGEPGKNNHTITVNPDHALTQRFYQVIDNASEGQIRAMNDKGLKAAD